jgi:uncharacterized membrane protein AbrB (regulator of aidB expression)
VDVLHPRQAGIFALIGLCGVSAWILMRLLPVDALTAYSAALIAAGNHADLPFVLALQPFACWWWL